MTLPICTRHRGTAHSWRGTWRWLLLAWLAALPFAVSAETAPTHNVLMLFSNGRLLPANVEVDRSMSEVFGAHPDMHVDLSVEFLDAPKFSGVAFDNTMVTYLREKYASRPPQVIVVAGEIALDFVLAMRAQMFPGTPVVYMAVNTSHLPDVEPLPDDVVGMAYEYDFPATVELALRWHPQARRLVVVTGTAPWDRDWEGLVRKQAKGLDASLKVEFLAGLPAAALKKRLGELGSDTVVFTPGFFRDGDGRLTIPRKAAQLIAGQTEAPVYGPFPTFIGTGIVGGVMTSYVTMGRMAADAALALLAGTAPAALVLPKVTPNQVHADWRQVQRFGIAPDAVPADALVSFREPSFWEAYGHFVAIAAAVMLIQFALIAALLIERRRRRRTASALAQSEQRMNLAARAARLSMWSWNLGGKQAPLRTPARRSTDHLHDTFSDFKDALSAVHPLDRPTVQHAVDHALVSGEEMNIEYRVEGPDGQTRWLAARGRAAQGGSQHLLGVAIDITPRKLAEAQAEEDRAALRHMTRVSLLGQLSASIAHQLNQPLAAILSNAEAAQKMLQREPVDLAELRDICDDIVAEDHRAAEVIRRLGALFKRGSPKLVPLDVNELVRDTLDLMRTNLLTRQVTVLLELGAALPSVDGDRVQLQQLLLNLIVNAADAMDATPQAERLLIVSTALADGRVAVCVADRGPGIAEADRPKIFEPFWSRKEGGMGMGLTICRSIAEAHRGELNSRNAPEGGAVFCVQLPIHATP